MISGEYNYVIEQGQSWIRYLKWRNSDSTGKDLSGANWTATLKIRPFPGHVGTPIEYLSKGLGITLSDGSGTPASVNIQLSLSALETAVLDFLKGFYTLELVNNDTPITYRLLEGTVFLSKECTN